MRRATPFCFAAALAALACSSRGGERSPASTQPVEPTAEAGVAPVAKAPPPGPAYTDLEPAPLDDRADGGTVTIKLVADARRQAHVLWGRKDLGVAPLELTRPRGSAPLDLTIQAPDCLPLHTRVFTDRDDTLTLRLYTEREAAALPGYSPTVNKAPTTATKTQRHF